MGMGVFVAVVAIGLNLVSAIANAAAIYFGSPLGVIHAAGIALNMFFVVVLLDHVTRQGGKV